MNPETIIRAWKDPEFRARLTPEQLQALPDNPSGKPVSELGDDELVDVVGGLRPIQPTPPIFITQGRQCGSAYDACPSALGCTFDICAL